MKKVESIIDFGGGEIVDRINFEMAKVIENINNPNTDEKPRKLTIEVKLTPKNNRKTIEMQTSVKAKVSPINTAGLGKNKLKQILKSITQKHLQLKLKKEQLLLLAN